MPSLTLPILHALTPKEIDVKIIDEQVENINFEEKVDAIGISCLTLNVSRGYDIAIEFRKRKIPVIMGGHHVTALPQEALQHCDSVAIGEGEEIWKEIIDDLKKSNLKKVYKSNRPFVLNNSPRPNFSSLNFNKYLTPPFSKFPLLPIQATRGCPFNCDFCSVSSFYGPSFRMRDIEFVISEIREAKAEYYFFVDDNIIGNIHYAKKLFSSLASLKIKWLGQFTMQIVNHPDLIELAAKSGCIGAYLGIESISMNSLESMNKKFNNIKRYAELFRLLNKHHIRPFASIIFGFDDETRDTFRTTTNFLIKNGAGKAYFYLLTPFPGTKFFDRISKENRILDTYWNDYDCAHVIIKPKVLKPQELENGLWQSYREFYSIPRIIIRNLRYSRFNPMLYLILVFYDLKLRLSIMHKLHPLCGGD